VPPGSWTVIIPLKHPGSMVEVEFRTPFELRMARTKVYSLRKFVAPERAAWLSGAKSDSELKPGCVLSRLRRALQQVQQEHEDASVLVKSGQDFNIKCGTLVLVYVNFRAEIQWAQAGVLNWPIAEERDQVKAYAEMLGDSQTIVAQHDFLSIALNAAGRGVDPIGLLSISSAAQEAVVSWDLLFFSEADFLSSASDNQQIADACFPHRTWRRYPGAGSRALHFMLNARWRDATCSVTWEGGCVILVLQNSSHRCDEWFSIRGLHGNHGEALEESLNDAATLISSSGCERNLVIGDWNVDQLPGLADDPCSHPFERSSHQQDRCWLTDAWCAANRVSVRLPAEVVGSPGSRWDAQLLLCEATRVPPYNVPDVPPSLLDFSAASASLEALGRVLWNPLISDRAMISWTLKILAHGRFRGKTRWKRIDRGGCERWLVNYFPGWGNLTWQQLRGLLLQAWSSSVCVEK
jgi:hypothetical protein